MGRITVSLPDELEARLDEYARQSGQSVSSLVARQWRASWMEEGTVGGRLARTGRVELRGFGSFHTVKRPPQTLRSPKTGQPVSVPEYRSVIFRASASMRKRLVLPPTLCGRLLPTFAGRA